MGQVRHGSATTTHAIRAAIQRSQASLATLSRELGINPKTVAKWRKRQTLKEMKTGPKEARSATSSVAKEAMVVAFRLLPLADCRYESPDQLRTPLADFMAAYNFGRRLKAPGGLAPYEAIARIWTS